MAMTEAGYGLSFAPIDPFLNAPRATYAVELESTMALKLLSIKHPYLWPYFTSVAKDSAVFGLRAMELFVQGKRPSSLGRACFRIAVDSLV